MKTKLLVATFFLLFLSCKKRENITLEMVRIIEEKVDLQFEVRELKNQLKSCNELNVEYMMKDSLLKERIDTLQGTERKNPERKHRKGYRNKTKVD